MTENEVILIISHIKAVEDKVDKATSKIDVIGRNGCAKREGDNERVRRLEWWVYGGITGIAALVAKMAYDWMKRFFAILS